MTRGAWLLVLLLTACAATADVPAAAPASLSLDELDDMAAAIEADVADVDVAFCDAGGGDPMANCYVGIATADAAEAQRVACDDVVPVIEEWTSGSVTLFTFDSRDEQTTGVADCS